MTHEERLRDIIQDNPRLLHERKEDKVIATDLLNSPRLNDLYGRPEAIYLGNQSIHSALMIEKNQARDPYITIIGCSPHAKVLNGVGSDEPCSADIRLTGRFSYVAYDAKIDGELYCDNVEIYGDLADRAEIAHVNVSNSLIHGDVGYGAQANIHVYDNSVIHGDVACEGCYTGVEVRNSRVNGDVARNAEITTDYFHVKQSWVEGSIGQNTSTEAKDEQIWNQR